MEWLRDFGCWVTDNAATFVDLLFAGVVAWAAFIGVKLNRRLIDAELDPAITIYIEADRLHWSFFDLVIKNAGRGPARNIRFEVDPDIPIETDDEESQLSRLPVFQHGINFMAPLQEIRTFYGSFVSLTKDPITIHVTYDRETPDSTPRTVRASFVIDVGQFEGLSKVGEAPELQVATALDKMADDLHRIREGGSWSNMTVTVKRRYFFSGPINRRWNRYARRWRNFRIRWRNNEEPWRRRWDRLRRRKETRA